jgi:hypothetical protein
MEMQPRPVPDDIAAPQRLRAIFQYCFRLWLVLWFRDWTQTRVVAGEVYPPPQTSAPNDLDSGAIRHSIAGGRRAKLLQPGYSERAMWVCVTSGVHLIG